MNKGEIELNITEYVGESSKEISVIGESEEVLKIIQALEDNNAEENIITIDEEEMIRYIEQDTMLNKLDIQMVIDSYDRYLDSKGLIED